MANTDDQTKSGKTTRDAIENPAGYVIDEVTGVLVGDFVRTRGVAAAPAGRFLRVIGLYRAERGVTLILREAGEDFERVMSDVDEVAIVTRIRNGSGIMLYRIPHPTRRGLACFVSIPEGA